jgi:hypothetical protein
MISKKKLCIMESQPIELSGVKFMLDVRENSYVKSYNNIKERNEGRSRCKFNR